MSVKFFGNGSLAIVGLVMSVYSIYVEHKNDHEPDDGDEFVALCDIEAIGASCSAVFALPEGKMLSFFGIVPHGHFLDLPNGFLGMLFYLYTFIRNIVGGKPFLFSSYVSLCITSCAFASSLFLGHKLYIIKELCVVCITTHVINTTLIFRAFREVLKKGSNDANKEKAA